MRIRTIDKLSIADRVKVFGIIDKGGVALVDDFGMVGVESETFINGHDCHGHGKDGHCLYVSADSVARISNHPVREKGATTSRTSPARPMSTRLIIPKTRS